MCTSIDDRKRGTLLGLAWGDALGCPVEYWSKEQIQQVYGTYRDLPTLYPIDAIPNEPRIRGYLRPLGLHSDDTQQAITLILSCLHPEGWSLERWTHLLLEGRRAMAWRGTGRNFRSALDRLAEGTPPLQSGSPTAGIGGAMRVAPLGALYSDSLDELADVIFEATWTTHADIRAVSMALAVSAASAFFVAGYDLERVRGDLVPYVASWEAKWANDRGLPAHNEPHVHSVSTALRSFLHRNWSDLDELRAVLAQSAGTHAVDLDGMHPPSNHAFVLLGGIHAICVALWPHKGPAELLAGAVMEGGDADTVGAIAGGLLGARFGSQWVPVHRCIDASNLSAYADCLVTRRLPELSADFLKREALLSTIEREHIARLSQPR